MLNARRGSVLVVLGAVLGLLAGANALPDRLPTQAPPAPSVAVVSFEKILNALKEREDRDAELKKQGTALQGQIDALTTELEGIEKEIKTLDKSSNEYRAKVIKAMETDAVRTARAKALQQVIDIDRGKVLRELFLKISASVDSYAQREGIELVVVDDRTIQIPENNPIDVVNANIRGKRLVYAAPRLDITDAVIAMMNNEYAAPKRKN